MAYEVVWDGTPRTSRYLLQADEPTRPAPPVSPSKPDATAALLQHKVEAKVRRELGR